VNIAPEATRALAAYVDLVRAWANRIDLIAPGDLDRFEERHVADSLRLLPLVEAVTAGHAVDVGSGAGLPGIPLAIVIPATRWRLLEPRAKRVAFLEEVVRSLGLDCEVVPLTAEEAARDPGLAGAHQLGVARALAPPTEAFGLLTPLLAPGGRAIVFAGRNATVPPEAGMWSEGIAIVDVPRSADRE
jgi:16S rRNA (guanine527-N7)-methyltransferase